MDDGIVIKAEHVSKKYCAALKQSMSYGIQDIGRNLCGLSSHPDRLRRGEFWAVDDVSFELKRGESLGLIGPNGSGKSTLLKLLNGIFWPDKGKITVKGRVGALIEVGAGFHPLLTGRENIYVNGAILGMTKKEIDDKFDDIVEFADIGDFIDVPVKNYSSGMFVRLGFAVAVHSESDILLVDEVLAVGDSAFRHKCMEKMKEIKAKQNVAIIFVSHDIYSVGAFCDKGLFVNKGHIVSQGNIQEVISDYQLFCNKCLLSNAHSRDDEVYCSKNIEITSITCLNNDCLPEKVFSSGDSLRIRIEFTSHKVVPNPKFELYIRKTNNELISAFGPHFNDIDIPVIMPGTGVIDCIIDSLPLIFGSYFINVGIYDETRSILLDWWSLQGHPELSFEISPNKTSIMMGQYLPICSFKNKWLLNDVTLEGPKK